MCNEHLVFICVFLSSGSSSSVATVVIMEYPPDGYPDEEEILKRYPSTERDIWKPDPNSCEPVIMANQFDLVKTCHAEGIPLGFYACPMAARQGNIEMLQWLVDNGGNFPLRMCMNAAARGGHIMTIQWLMEHDGQLNRDMIRAAIHRQDLTLLEHLVAIGCPMQPRPFEHFGLASRVGFIEGMEYIRNAFSDQHPSGYDVQLAVRGAAQNGHLDAVQWILEWQSESDCSFVIRRYAMIGALKGGHHEVAEYLYQLNPTPSAFCDEAMSWVIDREDHDTINVLQWMRDRGCKFSGIWKAIYHGRVDVMQWLKGHGHIWYPSMCVGATIHAKHEESAVDVLQYMHSGEPSTHPCAEDPCYYAVHGVPMVYNGVNSDCRCCEPEHCWCCNSANDHYAAV